MNTETILIFCDLVELKNFSRTAEKHRISQSAVSQQLAQLEAAHRCQLINRKSRPISLTPAGKCFYKACRDILKRYRQLKVELTEVGTSSIEIRLASILSIGIHNLQPYIKLFMKKYPSVRLVVEYLSSDRIYEGVLNGDIDMGIVAVPHQERHLKIHPIESEPMVLVCHPNNPLASLTEIDIRQLQGQPLVALDADYPTQKLIDGILKKHNVKVNKVMELANVDTIKRAVELDSGLGILTEPVVRAENLSSTLQTVRFTDDVFIRPAGIIVRKNKTFNYAGRYLLELLRKEV